ncbi:NFACT RNA binding domain-containing protein [Spirosoma sp. SC4-14]|uniref:NFACT RNA binding domain-containing protein n=1 Tax=Spirosoma sp. SC4-14 TaxID=3128900 RepID=UPI0030CC6D1C
MHTNYYFLRQLAVALEPDLTGLRFLECFSQDRDEVILVFAQAKGKLNYYKPFYVKATLRPDFSGLMFPDSVQRARTNSADLFEDVITSHTVDSFDSTTGENGAKWPGRAVVGVRAFLNERCLAILLEDNYTMLFKFFGNRPNLLAFYNNTVIDSFNQKLLTDRNLVLDAFDRPIDQSWEAYVKAGFDHRKLFPTFGKVVNQQLTELGVGTGKLTAEEQWNVIQQTLAQLERPRYYLTRLQHIPTLSLVPIGDIQREFEGPIEAANRFYAAYNGLNTFEREKGELLRLLEKRRKRAESLIEVNLQRMITREEGASHEEIGHILMANLHDIPTSPNVKSPETVTLTDFYRDRPIIIKLKTDLTPQKNAENYYRKAKNEKIEEDYLNRQIVANEAELNRIDQQKADLEAILTLKELRRYVKQHNLLGELTGTQTGGDASQLFKEVVINNFRILIGRNAKNNDLLTQKYAYKEDLWLHARDVPGSHVVIKYQAGKPFPKNVIERAGELAAWYSKRRTDSLCPVTVTPKKFVRKPKGLAEGQVVIEKEDVILVEPKE